MIEIQDLQNHSIEVLFSFKKTCVICYINWLIKNLIRLIWLDYGFMHNYIVPYPNRLIGHP